MSEQVTLIIWGVGITWISLAAIVGLVVGRVIRNRDRQIPRDPGPESQGVQRVSTEEETPQRPVSRTSMLDTPPRGQGSTQ